MECQSQDAIIRREIRIGGKDSQPAPLRDGTDQNVDDGNGNALRAASIRGLGGTFVIFRIHRLVTKCAKRSSKVFELGFRLNARQHLLADQAYDFRPAVLNQARQLADDHAFPVIEVPCFAPERQRPYGGVDKNAHSRLDRRSRL